MTASHLVFFDLETAGLNPKRHPIIQIAAIAVNRSLEPVEAFEAKVQFDSHRANKNSLRKNHYQPGTWAKEGKSEVEVARGFSEFLRRHASLPVLASSGVQYHVAQLVAHNSAFDGPYLQTWYEHLGIFLPARRQVLCTMQRAIWYFAEHPELTPPRDFKLATLCQSLGVSFHAASAHEALADVSATVRLYQALPNRPVLRIMASGEAASRAA